MNIDIRNARIEFKNYVKNYNPSDPKIALKISHIERVSQKAKQLAENLRLNEEDVKLAELIGILHDIGRFEQIRIYNTFMDKDSVNHAEYGVKVLFEDGLIRRFIAEDTYDNIIKKAILNHNKGYLDIDKAHFAYIYDFNYKFTLQKIKEDEFLTKLYSRFDIANNKAKENLGDVYNFAKEYLDKELGKAI